MIRRIKIIEPQPGAVREVRKFAWLPVIAGSFKIWLRSYEVLQVYRVETVLGIDYEAPKVPGPNKELQHKQLTLTKKYWDTIDARL